MQAPRPPPPTPAHGLLGPPGSLSRWGGGRHWRQNRTQLTWGRALPARLGHFPRPGSEASWGGQRILDHSRDKDTRTPHTPLSTRLPPSQQPAGEGPDEPVTEQGAGVLTRSSSVRRWTYATEVGPGAPACQPGCPCARGSTPPDPRTPLGAGRGQECSPARRTRSRGQGRWLGPEGSLPVPGTPAPSALASGDIGAPQPPRREEAPASVVLTGASPERFVLQVWPAELRLGHDLTSRVRPGEAPPR